MRRFVEMRIKPYYLHHADLAPGTRHLRTTDRRRPGADAGAAPRLSGLAMPAYMLDIPGGRGKAPIGPGYIDETSEGRYRVKDAKGEWAEYREAEG